MTKHAFSPTSLCRVLVFDSVSRSSRLFLVLRILLPICHTHTHNFVTHTHTPLSPPTTFTHHLCHTHTTLSHTTLSHTHNFVTCHFSHTHTQLCHTPSFTHTHTFVTHYLCVAGVALGDIHLCFAWQVWHFALLLALLLLYSQLSSLLSSLLSLLRLALLLGVLLALLLVLSSWPLLSVFVLSVRFALRPSCCPFLSQLSFLLPPCFPSCFFVLSFFHVDSFSCLLCLCFSHLFVSAFLSPLLLCFWCSSTDPSASFPSFLSSFLLIRILAAIASALLLLECSVSFPLSFSILLLSLSLSLLFPSSFFLHLFLYLFLSISFTRLFLFLSLYLFSLALVLFYFPRFLLARFFSYTTFLYCCWPFIGLPSFPFLQSRQKKGRATLEAPSCAWRWSGRAPAWVTNKLRHRWSVKSAQAEEDNDLRVKAWCS